MRKTRYSLSPKLVLAFGIFCSLILYAITLIDQLKLRHECMPEDGMCNRGNTVIGDIYWSLVLSGFVLVPVWIIGIVAYKLANTETTTSKTSH